MSQSNRPLVVGADDEVVRRSEVADLNRFADAAAPFRVALDDIDCVGLDQFCD